MGRVRVAACQINTVVGDLDGNAERILAALAEAERAGADLAVFPELTVTGYPPEDLLRRPAFVADNLAVFDRIAAATGPCAAVIGYVDTDPTGRLVNAAAALCAADGCSVATSSACCPTTGSSTSSAGSPPGTGPAARFVVAGVPVGMSICEDMWFAGGPMADQAAAGARLLVNLNASPYSQGRRRSAWPCWPTGWPRPAARSSTSTRSAARTSWSSTAPRWWWRPTARCVASAAQFAEEVLLVDLDVEPATAARSRRCRHRRGAWSAPVPPAGGTPPRAPGLAPVLDPEAEVYEALVLGTRDYVAKNGFSDAVIGLSGGIDSSLVAAVAVDALGPDHVHGVTMPSRYSSDGSVADAVTLAGNLGIDIATVGHRAGPPGPGLVAGAPARRASPPG